MRYFFIVNPTAGRGRAGRLWGSKLLPRLESYGIDFGFAMTTEPDEATYMARDVVQAGYDVVVGVGGDGTLHEVAAGLPTEGALGVIPAGTGNDFARTLGLPKDPERSLDILLQSKPMQIDRSRANGHPFLNVAGIGFDALVAQQVRERAPQSGGTLPYLMSVFRLLSTYNNTPVRIELDDETIEATALLVAIGNGAYVGGGMRICPRARIDDGLFDVCIVGDLSTGEALLNLPKLFRGSHTQHPKVRYLRSRRVRIQGDGVPCQADGEPIGTTPVELEMEPGSLTLLVPPRG